MSARTAQPFSVHATTTGGRTLASTTGGRTLASTTGGRTLASTTGGRTLTFATGRHVFAFTPCRRTLASATGGHALMPRHPEAPGVVGPVATRLGASSPVLGDAPAGGRSATACPTHLEAARDPVPRQVRREVPPT